MAIKIFIDHLLDGQQYFHHGPPGSRRCDYGGRGITICKEWIEEKEGFKNFYNWSIQNGYSED